jgi:16S rRNA (cytosine1407-C5)-methyltransferase
MSKRKKRSTRNQIPEEFFERLQLIAPNPTEFQTIKSTFVERPTTFRINTIKAEPQATINSLKKQNFKIQKSPWSDIAFQLQNKSKRELMETPEYEQGHIYIQSFASQIPPIVLDPKPGQKVLDLTAAPGSKTSQLAALTNQEANLTAVELNKPRFFKLKHNMEHLGVDADIHLSDGVYFAKQHPEEFEAILLDAPCSAEARFVESKPKTFAYWSRRKVKEMQSKQRRLLYAAWSALKPGGVLVYSTCTLAPDENEVQIHKMLERFEDCQLLPIKLQGTDKLTPVTNWNEKQLNPEVKNTLRLKPTSSTEGFFIAKMLKKQ